MKNFFEKTKSGSLLSSAAFLILGLLMLFKPDLSFDVVCIALGVIFVAFACVNVVMNLKSGQSIGLGPFYFIYILVGVMGIYFITAPSFIKGIIPMILGVLILLHSIGDIRASLILRDMGENYKWAMALSVITMIFALVILVNPFKTGNLIIRVIGAVFLYDGASALWVFLAVLLKQKKHNGAKTVSYKEF